MEYAISRPKMIGLPPNKEQTYRLNSKPQMWPSDLTLTVTLTLNFQGQIWNSLYLGQKWSDCHQTKSKHIDWTLSHKCDHRIWPWPWPWLWIFEVKFGICYISAKDGLIAIKLKVPLLDELKASMTIKFDFGHDLEKWGVTIYQIVTGVTSDVGMPSTHLVSFVFHFKYIPTG